MADTIHSKAEQLDLGADLIKQVRYLSPGGRRKLSIGMALIGDARVIILDEPTSNLDLESREQIWNILRGVAQGRAVLISTQHIDEAE